MLAEHRYDDYGTMNNLCDVVLGVLSRNDWLCPLCYCTGEGETGAPIDADDQEDHEKYRCPERDVTCAACGAEMKVADRLKHARVCKGPVVMCNRCGAKVRKCYAQNHLKKCVPFGHTGSLHLRLDANCTVTHLMEGGCAEKGGVCVGDVVIKVTNPIDTVPVANREDFMKAVGPRSEVFKGTKIIMHVLRDAGQVRQLRMKQNDPACRSNTLAAMRKIAADMTTGVVQARIVVGPETVNARENRRKRLESLRSVFPDINLDMIDGFMTDPAKCKKAVLDAFVTADDAGEGALGPAEMYGVFLELAKRAGIEPPSETDCRHAYREVNIDGNGLLTFDEFFPYLRSMIMEVVWAEGPLSPCPRCRRRTRERNQPAHVKLCCGDLHPRGWFQFDIKASTPLEVTEVGHGAAKAGMREGDFVLGVNGEEVKTKADVAKVCSPARGVVAGSPIDVVVQRGGTNLVETLRLVMFPLPEAEQAKVSERLIAACAKKLPKLRAASVRGVCLGGKEFRGAMRCVGRVGSSSPFFFAFFLLLFRLLFSPKQQLPPNHATQGGLQPRG